MGREFRELKVLLVRGTDVSKAAATFRRICETCKGEVCTPTFPDAVGYDLLVLAKKTSDQHTAFFEIIKDPRISGYEYSPFVLCL